MGSGNPPPSLSWVHNGVVLEPELGSGLSRYSLNAGSVQEIPLGNDAGITYFITLSLTVAMVTDTDAGIYECLAVNVAGNGTAQTSLEVNCE